jgi:hypothetical protein
MRIVVRVSILNSPYDNEGWADMGGHADAYLIRCNKPLSSLPDWAVPKVAAYTLLDKLPINTRSVRYPTGITIGNDEITNYGEYIRLILQEDNK